MQNVKEMHFNKSFKQKNTVAWFWVFGICVPEIEK